MSSKEWGDELNLLPNGKLYAVIKDSWVDDYTPTTLEILGLLLDEEKARKVTHHFNRKRKSRGITYDYETVDLYAGDLTIDKIKRRDPLSESDHILQEKVIIYLLASVDPSQMSIQRIIGAFADPLLAGEMYSRFIRRGLLTTLNLDGRAKEDLQRFLSRISNPEEEDAIKRGFGHYSLSRMQYSPTYFLRGFYSIVPYIV